MIGGASQGDGRPHNRNPWLRNKKETLGTFEKKHTEKSGSDNARPDFSGEEIRRRLTGEVSRRADIHTCPGLKALKNRGYRRRKRISPKIL